MTLEAKKKKEQFIASGFADLCPNTTEVAFDAGYACREEESKELIEAVNIILSNWPSNRDGMDYAGPLPAGVRSCREALKKFKGKNENA